jgi:hypothetical protein
MSKVASCVPWNEWHSTAERVNSSLPVFMQPWWLAAATAGQSSVCVDAKLSGIVAARLIYSTHRNKIGSRLAIPPFWSHLGGPILRSGLSPSEAADASRQIALLLPRGLSYRFACDPNSQYIEIICREFVERGFNIEQDPTYLVFPDEGDILSRMKSRHRTQIRSAGKKINIVDGSAQRFIEFYGENLETRSHSPLVIARRIIEAGLQRKQVGVFFATRGSANDPDSLIDAAICCAWDNSRYYYWMSRRRTSDNDCIKPNPEATKLLILHAIRHAQSLGLIFDADSPESEGGRGIFNVIFGIDRIEYRPILVRKTSITKAYDRAVPRLKRIIKSVVPGIHFYDPRSTF